MPLGHLVDLIWRWKSLLVYLGASLTALGLLIMVFLIGERATGAACYARARVVLRCRR